MTASDHPQSMPAVPTLEDFDQSGASDILADHPTATLRELTELFVKARESAEANGANEASRVFWLMQGVCSMMLQPDSKTAPLAPVFVWADGSSSMGPDHLAPEQIDLLARLADKVDHVALRARLADLVWMKGKRHGNRFALRAIDDYRAVPISGEHWQREDQASWQRALQLAVPLKGIAGQRVVEMEDALVEAFCRAKDGAGLGPLRYIRPLASERLGRRHAPQVASILEELARERIQRNHTFDAVEYLRAARVWFERAGNEASAAEMQVLLAQTWERHADGDESALTSHHFYSDAIAAYREVPARFRAQYDIDKAILTVRAKYEEAGRQSIGEMVEIAGPTIDLTELVEAALEHVQRSDPLEALSAFCGLDSTPNKAQYLQEAQAMLSETLVGRLFGGVTIASDGRTVSRALGAGQGPESAEALAENRAMQAFLQHAGMTAHGMIDPALDSIREQYLFTLEDFRVLARQSGIVPPDRANIVGQGLYAGYCRDLVQAMHILMPQFEHMVREKLQQEGALTTTHDSKDRIDMEIGLSNLTERSQMAAAFGENMTFAIRSLMCVQVGPNLRNAVAHGQADEALCEGPYGIYTWWLILRMVVRAYLAREKQAVSTAATNSTMKSNAAQAE